jgi:hypothetical protein
MPRSTLNLWKSHDVITDNVITWFYWLTGQRPFKIIQCATQHTSQLGSVIISLNLSHTARKAELRKTPKNTY